jgi:hypothetical protein
MYVTLVSLPLSFASSAAHLALPKLRQSLSTILVGKSVSFRTVCHMMPVHHPLLLQMLRRFVDLATRAIRVDMSKPRIVENDFDHALTTPDGSLVVQNARFKTRIRGSTQARCI